MHACNVAWSSRVICLRVGAMLHACLIPDTRVHECIQLHVKGTHNYTRVPVYLHTRACVTLHMSGTVATTLRIINSDFIPNCQLASYNTYLKIPLLKTGVLSKAFMVYSNTAIFSQTIAILSKQQYATKQLYVYLAIYATSSS